MKEEKSLKFSELPFIVPTEKRMRNKFEGLIKDLKECGSARTAALVIKHFNKYMDELSTQGSIIYVKYACDTTKLAYKKAQERLDELSPIISQYYTEFIKVLAKAKYRKELEAQYGKFLFKKFDMSLKAFDEKIVPDMIQQNKLTSKYDEIMGGTQIDFRGEKLNLSQLGKYTQSSDRDTRREAAQALDGWLKAHDEELGNLYSELVLLRDGMAKKLGFKNFVELGYMNMGRTDYNAKMVKGYREQIVTEVVPVCQKLYKTQMKLLGIKNPQYYDYNLSFASGNPVPAGDANFILNTAHEMYSKMSKETKEYFDAMVDREMMDLEARKGKAPGGFCTTFDDYNTPFIFSNFNGTSGDVDVLTHEGGHGFQMYLCAGIKIPEYRNPTMEEAEIHSMSMEFFAWPYADKFFGKDGDKYRYSHLVDAIEFLPYGITVDEFQHWVYEHPKATHEERCAEWKRIESRNLPHRQFDDCPTLNAGRWWLRQGHIFTSPFYYIDYTLAQVCAFQFLIEDRKSHDKAWKKYVKLCKCGGKYPFVELLEKNHVKNPFEEGTIHKIMGGLNKILKEFTPEKY